MNMEENNLKSAVEALIFASEKPITTEQIKKVLGGLDISSINKIITEHYRLLSGKNGKSLEDIIADSHKSIHDLQEFQKDSIEYYKDVEKMLRSFIENKGQDVKVLMEV